MSESETTTNQPNQELALARVYCWLVAVLHPGWAILIEWLLPNEYNDMVGRCTVGALFFVLAAGSFFIAPLRERLPNICRIAYSLFAIHWFKIVHDSGLSTIYVIGTLVVTFGFIAGFSQLRHLLVFSTVSVVSSLVTVFVTDAALSSKFMLVTGVVTSQVLAITLAYARAKILKELEAAETKAGKLQQQLIERELEAAEAVQRNLISPFPDVPTVDMAGFYKSATKTGGDWYGYYFDQANDYLYFWIGDVTGHGLPSALLTGVACGALYAAEKSFDRVNTQFRPEDRLRTSAEIINEIIFEKGGDLYMTMFFCGLHIPTGELLYLNAGHRHPAVVGKDREVKQLRGSNNLLGFSRTTTFRHGKVDLAAGDTVFFYTDGLVENRDTRGQPFGWSRLKIALKEAHGAKETINHVVRRFHAQNAETELMDDVTCVSFTWRADALRQTKKSA